MKNVLIKIVLALLIGILSSPYKTIAQCQCPTDIQPTNISWTSQGPVYITIDDGNGHNCRYEVYYCWRQYFYYGPNPILPVVEIWICSYTQTEMCDEDFTLPVWKIRKKLAERIILLNPNQLNWYYTPCEDPAFPNFVTLSFTCYDESQFPCGAVYCKYSYDVRICSGQIIITELGHEVVGSDCSGECTSHCDDE